MNSQEALTFINQLFQQQGKPVLSEFEDALFRGMWNEDDYSIIAGKTRYTNQYVREEGAKLSNRITNELEIIVTKRNFKNPIKNRYNNPPQTKPPNPQPKPTNHPLLHPQNPQQKPTTHPLLHPQNPQQKPTTQPLPKSPTKTNNPSAAKPLHPPKWQNRKPPTTLQPRTRNQKNIRDSQ